MREFKENPLVRCRNSSVSRLRCGKTPANTGAKEHTAPLISPELVRKFMLSRYRRVIEFGHSPGVHFFCVDSDDNIDSLIAVWKDAGIDIICPFEVQAGMDVVALRKKYGKDLRIWGGVDKRVLVEGLRLLTEKTSD